MPQRRPAAIAFRAPLLLAALTSFGCAPRGTQSPAAPPSAAAPAAPSPAAAAPLRCLAPAQRPALLHAVPDPDGFPSAQCVEKARALIAQLTLQEKFGQMFQAERGTVRE